MAVTSLNTYSLGSVEHPVGTITVTVHTELTLAASDIPAGIAATVLPQGYMTETLRISAEDSELQNMTCRLIEDYTVHAEGFWFKLLNGGELEIQINLDEAGVSSGDLVWFWGRVTGFDGQFEENSLVSGDIVRREAVVHMVAAPAARFAEITAQEVQDTLATATYWTEVSGRYYVPYYYIFDTLLNLAFGNTIGVTNTTQANEGMQYYDGSSWRSFIDLWCEVQDPPPVPPNAPTSILHYFINNNYTGMDIFRGIAQSHILYPRLYYSAKWRIELIAKGSSNGFSATMTEVNTPVSSLLYSPRHPTAVENINVENIFGSHAYYINGAYLDEEDDVPLNVTFDAQFAILWMHDIPLITDGATALYYVSGGTAPIITTSRHWDSHSAGWSANDDSSMQGIAAFIEANWGTTPPSMRGYEREYRTISPLDDGSTVEFSHLKFSPDCHIQINDGVSTRNFTPIEIGRDLIEQKTRVVWRET